MDPQHRRSVFFLTSYVFEVALGVWLSPRQMYAQMYAISGEMPGHGFPLATTQGYGGQRGGAFPLPPAFFWKGVPRLSSSPPLSFPYKELLKSSTPAGHGGGGSWPQGQVGPFSPLPSLTGEVGPPSEVGEVGPLTPFHGRNMPSWPPRSWPRQAILAGATFPWGYDLFSAKHALAPSQNPEPCHFFLAQLCDLTPEQAILAIFPLADN